MLPLPAAAFARGLKPGTSSRVSAGLDAPYARRADTSRMGAHLAKAGVLKGLPAYLAAHTCAQPPASAGATLIKSLPALNSDRESFTRPDSLALDHARACSIRGRAFHGGRQR
jgi:hypothetical protein